MMTSPPEGHPVFLPGRILAQLSSDAREGVVDGINVGAREAGRPTFDDPKQALGYYNTHFTDLDVLGERLVGADRGGPSSRWAGAMNEMGSAISYAGVGRCAQDGFDPATARREVPLALIY